MLVSTHSITHHVPHRPTVQVVCRSGVGWVVQICHLRTDTLHMTRRPRHVPSALARAAVRAACSLVLPAWMVLTCLAPTTAIAAEQPVTPISLDSLISSTGAGRGTPVLGQVERIELGSRGATVTLEGGEAVRLDFSGLAGVDGGPNYLGWGMMLFGMSVATRLLQTMARVVRPFAPRRRRRRDEYE